MKPRLGDLLLLAFVLLLALGVAHRAQSVSRPHVACAHRQAHQHRVCALVRGGKVVRTFDRVAS
jgi:hypothetical protein